MLSKVKLDALERIESLLDEYGELESDLGYNNAVETFAGSVDNCGFFDWNKLNKKIVDDGSKSNEVMSKIMDEIRALL